MTICKKKNFLQGGSMVIWNPQLTTAGVRRYKGGQAEVRNRRKKIIRRGEIEDITIENNELKIKFAWLASGEECPLSSESSFLDPGKWVMEGLEYNITTKLDDTCEVFNIGPSEDIGGGDRIVLNYFHVGETVALYPPDGFRVKLLEVQGIWLM